MCREKRNSEVVFVINRNRTSKLLKYYSLVSVGSSNPQLASEREDGREEDDQEDDQDKDESERELSERKDEPEEETVNDDLIISHGNQEKLKEELPEKSRIIQEEYKRLKEEILDNFNTMINQTFQKQSETFDRPQNGFISENTSETQNEPKTNSLQVGDSKEIRQKCEKLQDELMKKEEEIIRLKDGLTKLDELQTKQDDEGDRSTRRKHQLQMLQEKIKNIEDERDKLSSNVKEESEQCERLQKEVAEKNKKIDKLREMLFKRQSVEAELAEIRKRFESQTNRLQKIQEKNKTLSREKVRLQDKVKEKEEDIKKLISKLDEKHKQTDIV